MNDFDYSLTRGCYLISHKKAGISNTLCSTKAILDDRLEFKYLVSP